MKIIERKNGIEIEDVDFSAKHTCECGQCFRFLPFEGGWRGVARGRVITLRQTENGVLLGTSRADFDAMWSDYFDLSEDYSAIAEGLPKDAFTSAAVSFGKGLRILRQDPWEALCSFIISQCNNIPRIQGIIDGLCRLYGEEIYCKGEKIYTFPSASCLAQLSEGDLAALRCGYRAPYIIGAAKGVASEEIDFQALSALDTAAARKKIMECRGVGAKVADCFLLFGMHKLDAFPVDTWMKKAAAYYGGRFEPALFGKYAGIAQQYIFYYARSGVDRKGI